MLRRVLVPALVALGVIGCPLTCKPTSADLSRHEVRQLAFWGDRLRRPLENRIEAAPPELIDYMRMDNEVNHFEARPEAAVLSDVWRADIDAALAALPPKLKAKVADKLLGVFPVTGLGSSAYTDFVRDAQNVPAAAFVALDVQALYRTANDWLTWKESSPFLPDPAWRLEATLADDADDTIRTAVTFILIHEFGHVVAFDEDVHPLWSLDPQAVDAADYPFMELSWTVTEGRYLPKAMAKGGGTGGPGPIVYYRPSVARPAATAMVRYYEWLTSETDFVTLYAATNPFDDFADSLATYVHTVLMGKPFEIRIVENGDVRRTVHACWTEPRCAAKRRLLEEFLN